MMLVGLFFFLLVLTGGKTSGSEQQLPEDHEHESNLHLEEIPGNVSEKALGAPQVDAARPEVPSEFPASVDHKPTAGSLVGLSTEDLRLTLEIKQAEMKNRQLEVQAMHLRIQALKLERDQPAVQTSVSSQSAASVSSGGNISSFESEELHGYETAAVPPEPPSAANYPPHQPDAEQPRCSTTAPHLAQHKSQLHQPNSARSKTLLPQSQSPVTIDAPLVSPDQIPAVPPAPETLPSPSQPVPPQPPGNTHLDRTPGSRNLRPTPPPSHVASDRTTDPGSRRHSLPPAHPSSVRTAGLRSRGRSPPPAHSTSVWSAERRSRSRSRSPLSARSTSDQTAGPSGAVTPPSSPSRSHFPESPEINPI